MTASRPQHGRSSSNNPDHRPANPSNLRQSFSPASQPLPDDSSASSEDPNRSSGHAQASPPQSPTKPEQDSPKAPTTLSNLTARAASETTSLLKNFMHEIPHPGPCNHGTFSPRPTSPAASITSIERPSSRASNDTEGSVPLIDSVISGITGHAGWSKRWTSRMKSGTLSNSRALAEEAGIHDTALMYLTYYVPSLLWIRQYRKSYLKGDMVAALTMASIYVPMALSLADNLAHVPPINGLYSFVFNPFVYALLGSSAQMVIGPEAAGSLLVGTVVKNSVDLGHGGEDDELMHAQIASVVAGVAGAVIFFAGLTRLGFLDNVLSRPFLRGFISAIGFVIAVDQLIPELGLGKVAQGTGVSHGSSIEKIAFICRHLHDVHLLTFAVAGVSFSIIMVARELKRRMQPSYPAIAYVPDRFLVVVLSAILCWQLGWERRGVEILGPVKAASGGLFTFRWPFQLSHMTHIRDAMGTSFLIAMLGFFESSVAAKSLGESDTFPGMQLSANRELVALGTANLIGACFMGLPAFGGYGRSKVNKSTGGRTPLSSIFLSLITLTCIVFLLPYFYYLPKPVLSSMISVVAWSLIEECPSDISFFVRIRGWTELGLMAIIFLATVFYSLALGIAIGVGLSVLQVIRHSTRPRIQILGRIPGTNRFDNAELRPETVEFIDGCLIVKIPEPLTFANTGELKSRLRRLERYGTSMAHPAMPRLRREESNRNIVFDIHGVTSLDGSGTQVLVEIVRSYRDRGVRVFFSRGPRNPNHRVRKLMERSGIVEMVGGSSHFVDDIHEALRLTEDEESIENGDRDPSVPV